MIPDRIKRIRKLLGFSQEKLAQLLGVTWTTVHRWESGATGPAGNPLRILTLLEKASQEPRFRGALADPRASDPMYVTYLLLHLFYAGDTHGQIPMGGFR